MRAGGTSLDKSAIAAANERRYKDHSQGGMLTAAQIGEALKRLRRMIPTGPQDEINIDKTIYETMRNAGEIEIVFDRRHLNRLKVVLMIDNGGWSMEPARRGRSGPVQQCPGPLQRPEDQGQDDRAGTS